MRMDLQGRRKRRKGTRGFTLLDLTTTVVCVAVVGVTALPTYVNLGNATTITRGEAATIAALRSAIETQRGENMISGVVNPAGSFLPSGGEDLFALFDSAPPYQIVGDFDANTQDGTSWRLLPLPNEHLWVIFCPHYDAATGNWAVATQGAAWSYNWGSDPVDGIPPGLSQWFDFGHNN